jgi:predicted permease
MKSAIRQLLKSPGFTFVAVLTLAIGLGANTAVFSAVYSILLKPLPYPNSERLVSVRAMVKRDTWERRAFSSPDFRDYRANATRSFEAFAGYDGANFNLTGDGDAARVRAERVSAEFFEVLGTNAALGRTFTAEEDVAPDQSPLVVLGHDLWRTRFGASVEILGQQIKLSDVAHTVIGVMPPGFRGLNDSTQIWVPMSTIDAGQWNSRGDRWHNVVARLKSGVSIEQARAELAATGLELARLHPQSNTNYSADAVPLRDEFFGDLRRPLLILLAAVGFVLVITCVNVANLLLVRLSTRRREIAIRLSLGAARTALARMFLGESLALAFFGGALGALFAMWFVAALKRFAPLELPRFVELDPNWAAFTFAAILALACALVIGALPALLAARFDLNSTLKDSDRSGHGSSTGSKIRTTLVAAELALSLVLLVASSLLGRSFVNLVSQPTGYETQKIIFQRVVLPHLRYDGGARAQFGRMLLERITGLPGVQSAALATDTPLDGNLSAAFTTIEGGATIPPGNEGRAHTHVVTRGFFESTGMTLLQGETFARSYTSNSEPVAIVSERFAGRFWPGTDALGKRFKLGKPAAQNPWLRIIGVVTETKYRSLVASPTADPDIYLSFEQRPATAFAIVLRAAGESRNPAGSVRQLVASLDPTIPVFALTTIEERVARASASQRFSAQLMGAFAAMALLLGAIGLYGVVSFSVGQRTQEIGVRVALGARPLDIIALILGHTGRLVAMGLLAGTLLAIMLSRFIETLLFNVNARDPQTYLAVTISLAAVALVAAWIPARRASKVDAVIALRAE